MKPEVQLAEFLSHIVFYRNFRAELGLLSRQDLK